MHFAPPSSLPRAAVGYPPASFFALSPRLIDRSRGKTLHTLQAYRPIGRYRRSKHRKSMTYLKLVADTAMHYLAIRYN